MEFSFSPETAAPVKNTCTTGKKWIHEKENGYTAYQKLNARHDAAGELRINYLVYTYNGEPDGYPSDKSAEIPRSDCYAIVQVDALGGHPGILSALPRNRDDGVCGPDRCPRGCDGPGGRGWRNGKGRTGITHRARKKQERSTRRRNTLLCQWEQETDNGRGD